MEKPAPEFYKTPVRYLRWASVKKPAYFYSIIIGLMGPMFMIVVPPVRRWMGDGPRPKVPFTYPGTYGAIAETQWSIPHGLLWETWLIVGQYRKDRETRQRATMIERGMVSRDSNARDG